MTPGADVVQAPVIAHSARAHVENEKEKASEHQLSQKATASPEILLTRDLRHTDVDRFDGRLRHLQSLAASAVVGKLFDEGGQSRSREMGCFGGPRKQRKKNVLLDL